MAIAIPAELISSYRANTFRLLPDLRLKSQEDAVKFVNDRGFVFFWPISGFLLPSLWAATAGDRPVADAHDDPGHITWGWKDGALGGDSWYYAKILRKKATMVSLAIIPFFYALTENYGAYEEDYLTQYEQGRLTQEARLVYEILIREGPLDTVALRRATHLSSPASESRFNRALADLQADFKIVPVAVTQAGAWHYAFAYDVTARHYPEIPEQAHHITETEARIKLAECYLLSLGVARETDFYKLFGWKIDIGQNTIDGLVKTGIARRWLQVENQTGEWVALANLCPLEPQSS